MAILIGFVMPQLLHKPPKKFELGPQAITLRPALAFYIARIAATWALVENQQGVVLAMMLKSERALGMYMALTSSAARMAALRAVAEKHFDSYDYKRFEQVMRDTSGPQSERNEIVHSVWAASDEYPEVLLRVPSKDHLRWFAMRVTTSPDAAGSRDEVRAIIARYLKEMEKYDPRFWSWDEGDFKATEARIQHVQQIWGWLMSLVGVAGLPKSTRPSIESEGLLARYPTVRSGKPSASKYKANWRRFT